MASTVEILLLIGVTILLVYLALPALAKAVLRRRFLRRVRHAGCACLTFDDGPNPEVTPRIAEALHRAGVRATFFLIGERAARYPEVTRMLARLGHELGEHGGAHKNAWKSGPWTSFHDLWGGHRMLAEACDGASPATLRPPFGKLNLVTLIYCWLKRRSLAFWDVDPRDYAQSAPGDVARYVLQRLAPGRVILLHDGRARPGSDAELTLRALDMILERAASSGIQFATVSEAMALGANGREEGS